MITILNNISKSLGVELTKFLQKFRRGLIGSKQAFSKGRYKIKHEAFIDLNDTFIKAYYEQGGYQLYKNKYLLLASDGSDYELAWVEELREDFGVADNGLVAQPMCMAKGVKIWDVLNRLTVSAHLGHYDVAEIRHFKVAWQKAMSLLCEQTQLDILLLGDMHYPSFWLMSGTQTEGVDFLFRCKPSFCREVKRFMRSNSVDKVLNIPLASDGARKHAYKKSTGLEEVPEKVQIRALKFTRPSGKKTCLVTSISSQDLDGESICELYPYRWGEEVSFNIDKNRTEIENFSAKMPQGIRQEWYANVLATNLAQLIIEDAQQRLDKEQAQRANKYDYQINWSVALGLIKDEIPKMLFGKERPVTFYNRMIKLIVRHREPIRPDRSFPRKRKHRLRFSMNLRRVI
ncbi:MAG: transposase [Bacteroidetes bacterium]|nr:transposase [Bacteroidota bacterium]